MKQKEFKAGDKVCIVGTVTDVAENGNINVVYPYEEKLRHYPDVTAMQAEIDEYRKQLDEALAKINEYWWKLNLAGSNDFIQVFKSQYNKFAEKSSNELHCENEELTNTIALKDAEINALLIEKKLLTELLTNKFRHQ